MQDDYRYVLRVPTASTIYPRATVEESISALDDVNRSLPTDKSFPEEIRLLINEQVRANPTYEKIHSTWTSLTYRPNFFGGIPEEGVNYDKIKKSLKDRVQDMDETTEKPFKSWRPVEIAPADISSYKSILPSLLHNITSREVDTVNGTAILTTIISSSLLFYRLLCHFCYGNNNVNNKPSITSVWQFELQHKVKGASILFLDDHGLFDIRVSGEEEAKEVMNDIESLVNALCSDECCHPYDGVVAGCAA
ncbi:hypothetical protein Clacol_000191 [Clathrus columnatus]|uniref:Uncharacterized protein n=1 Tax=Clathrus columnatus TaxID=1419009 RepID=A0AAV4ZYH8_9AGAM|nr:hypothetical protein Clacol_000191 [Clathrus columnatus]